LKGMQQNKLLYPKAMLPQTERIKEISMNREKLFLKYWMVKSARWRKLPTISNQYCIKHGTHHTKTTRPTAQNAPESIIFIKRYKSLTMLGKRHHGLKFACLSVSFVIGCMGGWLSEKGKLSVFPDPVLIHVLWKGELKPSENFRLATHLFLQGLIHVL